MLWCTCINIYVLQVFCKYNGVLLLLCITRYAELIFGWEMVSEYLYFKDGFY